MLDGPVKGAERKVLFGAVQWLKRPRRRPLAMGLGKTGRCRVSAAREPEAGGRQPAQRAKHQGRVR
eukprot:3235108-Lingulodinium_polyedra.AAC.1